MLGKIMICPKTFLYVGKNYDISPPPPTFLEKEILISHLAKFTYTLPPPPFKEV
jgi:hypothetical protein